MARLGTPCQTLRASYKAAVRTQGTFSKLTTEGPVWRAGFLMACISLANTGRLEERVMISAPALLPQLNTFIGGPNCWSIKQKLWDPFRTLEQIPFNKYGCDSLSISSNSLKRAILLFVFLKTQSLVSSKGWTSLHATMKQCLAPLSNHEVITGFFPVR